MSTINDFFHIGRGQSNLTEEFLYNNYGKIPVISATSTKFIIFGYVDAKCVINNCIKSPVILIVRVGNAGSTQLVSYPYYVVTENVLFLYPKKEYEDDFELKWLEYTLNKLLSRNSKGDIKGQRNISSEIIQRIEFKKPEMSFQNEISKLILETEKISDCIKKASSLLKNYRIYDETIIEGKEVEISKIINFVGGNNELTEEFVYNNQPNNEEETIPILSGATLKSNFMGYISRQAHPNNNILKIFSAPSVLVTRNGVYAGTMIYLDKGDFTINDHAYILTLKNDWKEKINLRWFVYQYQELFYNIVSSKSDNATFNKTYAERQKIIIPDKDFQDGVAEKLLKTDHLIEELEKANEQIGKLLSCEIIS